MTGTPRPASSRSTSCPGSDRTRERCRAPVGVGSVFQSHRRRHAASPEPAFRHAEGQHDRTRHKRREPWTASRRPRAAATTPQPTAATVIHSHGAGNSLRATIAKSPAKTRGSAHSARKRADFGAARVGVADGRLTPWCPPGGTVDALNARAVNQVTLSVPGEDQTEGATTCKHQVGRDCSLTVRWKMSPQERLGEPRASFRSR